MNRLHLITTLIVGFLTVGLTCVASGTETDMTATEGLEHVIAPAIRDFDQMAEKRLIRVLMPYSKPFFFFDGAQPRGASYEAIKQFETFVNEKMKTKTLKINILVVPTARENLIPYIKEGRGDLAVGNMTITDDRLQDVDFSDPIATGIKEILVTVPGDGPYQNLFDLAGKKIHVRKSSSYYQSLLALNETLRSLGKAEVEIVPAEDHLEDEDLLELVNAGIIERIVIDSHKSFWADIFDNIELHPHIALRTEGRIAWALRKDSPKFKAVVNEFVKDHKVGTLFGNIIVKRYLQDTSHISNSIYTEHLQRFQVAVGFFRKYGDQYDFDHLLLAALGYQESQLNQKLRSNAGAVGVMQVLPSTAKDKNVAIPNIEELEPNIHAGTKYLRFMADNYYGKDKELDPLNRALLTFASYNAGPARVAKLRREAEQMGLDPNKWFGNVEVVAAKRIGRETVQYVSNIAKYYTAYRLLEQKLHTDEPVHLTPGNTKKKAGEG